MPTGPGKYDDVATVARVATNARAVVLIVLGGNLGGGFSVQFEQGAESEVTAGKLILMLRMMADEIERSMES